MDARTTPVVAGDLVYASGGRILSAVNKHSGAVVWQFEMPPNYGVQGGGAFHAGFAFDGKYLVANGDSGFYILDGMTGAQLVSHPTMLSPRFPLIVGDVVITAGSDGYYTGYRIPDGQFIHLGITLPIGVTPGGGGAVYKDKLFLLSGDRLYAFHAIQQFGSVAAHKFQDTNQNGLQDPDETNLAEWPMTLYQGGGCTGSTLNSGTTDTNGNFTFNGLLPGTYSVRETLQDKWVNTTPICQSVVVGAGQSQVVHFGNWPQGGQPPKHSGSEIGLLLPFSVGQTWTICQGYFGPVSHKAELNLQYALDLSIDPNSAKGPLGCGQGPNASDNQIVIAPGSGKVVRFTGDDATNDLVCIDLDAGGSVQIGHIIPQKTGAVALHKNDPVLAGEQIGIVLPLSQSSKSGYAHIHIEAFSKSKCQGKSAVPFTGAFQFQCVPPLADDGGENQHRGKQLTRC